MTRSTDADTDAVWAIEIERSSGAPSEFYSIVALRTDRDNLRILTVGGTEVSFKTAGIKKLLIMKVVPEQVAL